MHVIFRESHGLEETGTPTDLGQSPADLVVLSFSDSDLGAFAAGWARGGGRDGGLPSLRLANLAALTHPVSVDTYLDRTLSAAKGILIRLIGGRSYWAYGLDQVAALAAARGIALAVLPADGRADPQLDAVSTVPASTLSRLGHLCDTGGAVAAQAALQQLALAAGLYAGPVRGAKALPLVGAWTPEDGVSCPAAVRFGADGSSGHGPAASRPAPSDAPAGDVSARAGPRVLVVFYRSYLVAADLGPVTALFAALRARGCTVAALFAPSLKAPDAAAWLARQVAALAPSAIVNATAFSGRAAGGASPLDAAGVPVFQVALATSDRAAWASAERGLSPADLAMHVVLPEVDGRIFAGAVSFKEPAPRDPDLEFARTVHAPESARIDAAADRVAAWVSLGRASADARRVALVLSTYPGRDWNLAHAVGLDALESAAAILADLDAAGYDTGCAPGAAGASEAASCGGPAGAPAIAAPAAARDLDTAAGADASLAAELAGARLVWPMSAYRVALDRLPQGLRDDLSAAWGAPGDDPDAGPDGFIFRALRRGRTIVALQPERGDPARRGDEYHDLSRVPRHAYVAFYLWLQDSADALVHVGAHGTLEWLPGKSVALSGTCWPEALTGKLPVIYPFIVNDPGEAAQAKRRIGAVTLGHVPPPQREAGTPARLARLEALLDEFSNADGLDPARRDRLTGDIREEARALGVEADLGLDSAACAAEAITRIDTFVCDVKESQFGDGLHVWGRGPAPDAHACGASGGVADSARDAGPVFDAATSAAAERRALIDALDARRIEAGPSGSPYRGRTDVLPTGRNLYTTDPRGVPTRSAFAQGVRLADALVRAHLQDEGDWPRGVVVDLWGSATMRTAGEEFAMALALLGVRPVWDAGSERVSGIEVVPVAELDRPRIDVTLRISGLFRDVFPTLSALFQQAVRTLAARDEAPDWNPYSGRTAGARVYGPRPGVFGLRMGAHLTEYSEDGRRAAGAAWLEASAWAFDGEAARADPDGIGARVAAADAFVHAQDLPETDLLLAEDYASHEAGFAAAQAVVGGRAALWHLDNTDPARPRPRTLDAEIARVVQARAATPDWIRGMRRHGFRGAAEIAATLEHMAAFAHLADAVGPHLFDLYWEATLGDPEVTDFLAAENPGALAAMQDRFAALSEAGLWQTRRNAIRDALESGA